MATKVQDPVSRSHNHRYKHCSMCGERFTNLGLARHWPHCKKQTEEYKQRQLGK